MSGQLDIHGNEQSEWPPRSPLYEAARAVAEDWRDRVSLGYEGDWPQMEELAHVLHDIDQALAALDEYRTLMRNAR